LQNYGAINFVQFFLGHPVYSTGGPPNIAGPGVTSPYSPFQLAWVQ